MIRTYTDYVGPKRWILVRIHPDRADMARAADRLNWRPANDWDGVGAVFQPTTSRMNVADGIRRWPRNGFAGVLRLVVGNIKPDVVAHELMHAALQIFRMNVAGDVHLGDECEEAEEQLAYIYGELSAGLHGQITMEA